MPDLKEGVSSPDVKEVQQLINEYYQETEVPELGDFDDFTTAGVKRFQGDVNLRQTGIVDAATLKLLRNPPTVQGHCITLGNEKIWLTDNQYKNVVAELAKAAEPTVAGYQRKVEEIRNIWDAHSEVRKQTFFLIPAVVDVWARVSFPKESVIKAAEAAVAKMQAAIKSGTDAADIADTITDGQKPIEIATTQMKEYRDKFYDGGERLIKSLETLKEASVDTLEICAAIATGGSSLAVTAGVMASVGAYKSVLTQIDRASTTPKFNVVDAFGNVLVDGAVEGTVGALLHDDGFIGGLTGRASKYLGKTVLKQFGSDVTTKVAATIVEKAFKSGADKAAGKAVEDLVESFKPGSTMTMDEAVRDILDEFWKGSVYGTACVKMSHQLEDFTDDASKYFKPGMFKGLGKVDIKKAWDKGGEQIVEEAMKRIGAKLIEKAADDPKDMENIDQLMKEAIVADARTNSDLAALVKKKGLE